MAGEERKGEGEGERGREREKGEGRGAGKRERREKDTTLYPVLQLAALLSNSVWLCLALQGCFKSQNKFVF